MKTVLEELYYESEGAIGKIKDSEKFKNLHCEYIKTFDKLLDTLNDGQKEIFEELYSLSDGMIEETGITYFKEGFKLCMRLFIEGLQK